MNASNKQELFYQPSFSLSFLCNVNISAVITELPKVKWKCFHNYNKEKSLIQSITAKSAGAQVGICVEISSHMLGHIG